MLERPRRLAVTLAVVALLLAAPVGLARLTLPDATPPTGLGRPIRAFSDAIWHLFGRSPLWYTRFVAVETGPDDLVILYFEVRDYPYLTPGAEVFLVARCSPIGAIDPAGMGGGTVIGTRANDAELEYLRSDAQPECPSIGR